MILSMLSKNSFEMYVYVKLLNYTGMRPNEGLGLHIDSVVLGKWPEEEKWIGKSLKQAGYSIYGYILLSDQPETYALRDQNGHVKRKPLKSKRIISPENSRLIPIIDKSLAEDLKMLKQKLKSEFDNNVWGADRKDYLLFGFSYPQISKVMRTIFDQIGSTSKSLYCFRHTFITLFSGAFGGDTRMAERLVGHTDKKMMIRYNKLRQLLQNQAEIDSQAEDIQYIEVKAVNFD